MRRYLWALMVVLSILTAIYSWRFIFFTDFFAAEEWQHHLYKHPVATYAHFGLGPLALMIGGFQFLEKIRLRNTNIHRTIGWIYTASCIWAGVAALPLAVNTTAGPLAAVGFLLLSVFWVCATGKALILARQKDFYAHRVWMIRSFALTFAGVTLRLYIGLFHGFMEIDFAPVYTFAAWFSWVGNLLAVELYLASQTKQRANL